MMEHHLYRFGVQIAEAASGNEWQAKAQKVEHLGYDILAIPDHFGGPFAFEPALAAAALATTTLRIGTLEVRPKTSAAAMARPCEGKL